MYRNIYIHKCKYMTALKRYTHLNVLMQYLSYYILRTKLKCFESSKLTTKNTPFYVHVVSIL